GPRAGGHNEGSGPAGPPSATHWSEAAGPALRPVRYDLRRGSSGTGSGIRCDRVPQLVVASPGPEANVPRTARSPQPRRRGGWQRDTQSDTTPAVHGTRAG